MKHRMFDIGWLLLLGAAINIAVAWCCEIWIQAAPCALRDFACERRSERLWSGYRWSQPGAMCVAEVYGESSVMEEVPGLWTDSTVMPHWLDVREPDDESAGNNRITYLFADARGWPCLSLWSQQRRTEWPQNPAKLEMSTHAGLDVHLPSSVFLEKHWSRCIPLRPIWPGFAINTVFYAAALWLMLTMLNAIVRRVRGSRRLCPDCGYPMGVTGVCSECGAQLPRAMP